MRKHLTYANLTSTMALCIALGMGSAYAANQLAPKSVGAKQLRPGAVTADKVRKHAITAPKIESLAVKQGKLANGAVVGSKLGGASVTSQKLATAAVTPEKIPDDSVTGQKVNEASLGQVPSAGSASFATFAETSNPEAFARVDAEGTVYPAFSKGIGTADVKQGKEAGIYCVNVPGFVPEELGNPEFTGSGPISVQVRFGGTASCPYPQIEVQAFNGGVRLKLPFYLVAYR